MGRERDVAGVGNIQFLSSFYPFDFRNWTPTHHGHFKCDLDSPRFKQKDLPTYIQFEAFNMLFRGALELFFRRHEC